MSKEYNVQGGASLPCASEGWVRLAVKGQQPCSIPADVAVVIADTIERLEGSISDPQGDARIEGDGTGRFRAAETFEAFDARYPVGVYGDRLSSITAKGGIELGVADIAENKSLSYASTLRAAMSSLIASLRAAAQDATQNTKRSAHARRRILETRHQPPCRQRRGGGGCPAPSFAYPSPSIPCSYGKCPKQQAELRLCLPGLSQDLRCSAEG